MEEKRLGRGEKIISKTDQRGNILEGNDTFFEFCEYHPDELVGMPHNIIRHPEMPQIVFRLLWAKLRDGQNVNAFVKNRTKYGNHYWVYATVSPTASNIGNRKQGFYSIRKAPNPAAVEQMTEIYRLLKEKEEAEGYLAAKELLRAVLLANELKFNDLMKRLQAQGNTLKLP